MLYSEMGAFMQGNSMSTQIIDKISSDNELDIQMGHKKAVIVPSSSYQ